MASKCIHKKKYNLVNKAFSSQSRRCVSTITKSLLKLSNLFINLYVTYEYFFKNKVVCVLTQKNNGESAILRHNHL